MLALSVGALLALGLAPFRFPSPGVAHAAKAPAPAAQQRPQQKPQPKPQQKPPQADAAPTAEAAVTGAQAGTPAAPATAANAAAPTVVYPPEGWWVPATLKLPKAAEGRVAWRFTAREVITVDKDNKLERRPADLKPTKANAFTTDTPVPMQLEVDEKQRILTVTILKPKVAFFTLNPAGDADRKRFDSLVIDVHAEPAEVREVCEKAGRCARFAEHPEMAPPDDGRSLTTCQEALSRIRQELAASRRAIPTVCR